MLEMICTIPTLRSTLFLNQPRQNNGNTSFIIAGGFGRRAAESIVGQGRYYCKGVKTKEHWPIGYSVHRKKPINTWSIRTLTFQCRYYCYEIHPTLTRLSDDPMKRASHWRQIML